MTDQEKINELHTIVALIESCQELFSIIEIKMDNNIRSVGRSNLTSCIIYTSELKSNIKIAIEALSENASDKS